MRIIIVDDDPLICKSLALTLAKEADITILGTASDGKEAVAFCQKNLPDIVLMDIRMPNIDGIQATRLLKKQFPQLRIMMLTTFQDKQNIQMALQAGADGYLLKTDKISDIPAKLRILATGAAILDEDVLKHLTTSEITGVEKLTPRENDILHLVAQGLTNKEISKHLFLSEGTVRNIISVIMAKLAVKNRTQLSLIANGQPAPQPKKDS